MPSRGWRATLSDWINLLVSTSALLGIAAFAVEYGFRFPEERRIYVHGMLLTVAAAFALAQVVRLAASDDRRAHLVEYRIELFLLGLLLASLAAWPGLFLAWVKIYLGIALVLFLARVHSRVAEFSVRPAGVVVGSFALLILAGTAALMLPLSSSRPEAPIRFVEAFFTATSAACVTGLGVLDVGTSFSGMGRGIILALIQVGGLGLVVYVAFFSLLQQRSMGVRHAVLMRDILSQEVIGEIGRLLGGVLVITLLVEALGAAALWTYAQGPDAVEWAVFHSVSAFCNAGFSLWPSTVPDRSGVILILLALTVVGGLGYPTILNLLSYLGAPRARRGQYLSGRLPSPPRLTVQTRMVVLLTFTLLAVGMAAFWIGERNNLLKGRAPEEAALVSAFQSGVARTSGFTAVDLREARPGTLLATMALMVVGGSPASTAGGVKTVTVALVVATVAAMLRNRREVELFGRSIPQLFVHAAVAVIFLYALLAFGISLALLAIHPEIPYLELLFETVSAMSTVGLTAGATEAMGTAGRLILCLAMFLGRIGPLAILLSIATRQAPGDYRYPEESVIVS